MIIKAINHKHKSIAYAIALISLVTVASALAIFFLQPNTKLNAETFVNQAPKQSPSPSPISGTGINETDSLNGTSSSCNYTTAPLNKDQILADTINSTTNTQPELTQIFFSLRNNPSAPITADPVPLDTSKFSTYTYGGYCVQQPDPNQFMFSFPDNTRQGEIAGSDALTWGTFAIQKIDFDAAFIAPKIGALGFDEMVVFATSDTVSYKGIEFGIRMDVKYDLIYSYIQEPNGFYGDVNFQMLKLMPNDGLIHHFTIFMLGSEVSFCIDGKDCGGLNFLGNPDYSSLNFSICAVVHRFTDDWDSSGDYMIAENFYLNQQ